MQVLLSRTEARSPHMARRSMNCRIVNDHMAYIAGVRMLTPATYAGVSLPRGIWLTLASLRIGGKNLFQ